MEEVANLNYCFCVKFNAELVEIHVQKSNTFAQLKQYLAIETKVLPATQKIMGIRLKNGQTDKTPLHELRLPRPKRGKINIQLIGNPEEDMFEEPEDTPFIVDDFDFWPGENTVLDYVERQQLLHIAIQKTEINLICPIDHSKKLIVLDLDKTILDFSGRKYTNNAYGILVFWVG
eukprot:TRINITY_DN6372_c0_g1_i2.p1 TRINITY_DN6372_c0_g1~~TRINITY_DN6372_c0_g1_i2.p1  ORF type:complete len:175 (+),score=39.83 TRINITY_DN6372_c0_g1_i2:282-806(+)